MVERTACGYERRRTMRVVLASEGQLCDVVVEGGGGTLFSTMVARKKIKHDQENATASCEILRRYTDTYGTKR